MVARRRISKVLLAPDGTQACAQLGMVDGNGALFYVLDADGASRYLRHHPMSHVMADIETEARRVCDERDETAARLKRTAAALEAAISDIEFLLGDGDFTRGVKSDYRQRLGRLKAKLEEARS